MSFLGFDTQVQFERGFIFDLPKFMREQFIRENNSQCLDGNTDLFRALTDQSSDRTAPSRQAEKDAFWRAKCISQIEVQTIKHLFWRCCHVHTTRMWKSSCCSKDITHNKGGASWESMLSKRIMILQC